MRLSRLQGRQSDLHPAANAVILLGSVVGLTGATVDADRVGRVTATPEVDDFSQLPVKMSVRLSKLFDHGLTPRASLSFLRS